MRGGGTESTFQLAEMDLGHARHLLDLGQNCQQFLEPGEMFGDGTGLHLGDLVDNVVAVEEDGLLRELDPNAAVIRQPPQGLLGRPRRGELLPPFRALAAVQPMDLGWGRSGPQWPHAFGTALVREATTRAR